MTKGAADRWPVSGGPFGFPLPPAAVCCYAVGRAVVVEGATVRPALQAASKNVLRRLAFQTCDNEKPRHESRGLVMPRRTSGRDDQTMASMGFLKKM